MVILKRRIASEVRNHLDKKEITLITGPRQAGKSTLMHQMEKELQRKGRKTLFLDLDREEDRPFFESQDRLMQTVRYEFGDGHGFVFIDEIQRKENAGLFLKGIYDRNLPFKLVVSGSGSLELKEKIHESLVGRKRIFELTTLSFAEFVDYETTRQGGNTVDAIRELTTYFEVYQERSFDYLQKYLAFGGYPRVVIEEKETEKQAVISEIYRSYLERDISVLLRIQKTESLIQLVRILASQTGQLVNISELSGTLGLAVQTVKEYLWYLEKTFIIQKVTPYFRNIRKEITKASIYYFTDLGLRNYTLNQFGNITNTSTTGFLFQNFVFNSLKERISLSPATIHFWRSKDKAEVDFVVDLGQEIIPIEVKYSRLEKPGINRSFQSFLTKYSPKRGYVIHLGKPFDPYIFGETTVYCLPFYNIERIKFSTATP